MAATEAGTGAPARVRRSSGSDRLSVALYSLAAFLLVLALLASELRAGTRNARPHQVIVLRKVYRTTVIETIAGGHGGTSVSQSVSSSGSTALPVSSPTTRTS